VRRLPLIIAVSLLPTLLLWLPFILRLEEVWSIPLSREGMATVIANYDGPLYLVVAKTMYNLQSIQEQFSFPLPVEYYAAHFPMFPFLIRIVGEFLHLVSGSSFGYPWAMLIVTLLTSIFSIYYFYKLAEQNVGKKDALWLTLVFSLFPARWLIVRSVGSPEPLFIGAIIASIYHFKNENYWRAGMWGVVAQLTKSPGILLFVAYGLALFFPKFKQLASFTTGNWFKSFKLRTLPVILIPLALLGVFIFYAFAFQDPLAYFNSGDNIHLLFPPFQIFDFSQSWVGTFWLEEVIFVYLFGLVGAISLFKQKQRVMAWFVTVFFTSLIFVSHRDIMRYALPIVPFLIIAFANLITQKEFKWAFAILIIPIYLFSLAYITNNVMPISDWAPFL
jgi:hypothetical protein